MDPCWSGSAISILFHHSILSKVIRFVKKTFVNFGVIHENVLWDASHRGEATKKLGSVNDALQILKNALFMVNHPYLLHLRCCYYSFPCKSKVDGEVLGWRPTGCVIYHKNYFSKYATPRLAWNTRERNIYSYILQNSLSNLLNEEKKKAHPCRLSTKIFAAFQRILFFCPWIRKALYFSNKWIP